MGRGKARSNLAKHGITFEAAKLAFLDRFALELFDDVAVYGEERYILVGMVRLLLCTMVYTERNGCIRIISARHATSAEEKLYDENRRGRG
jgi:uncharacterized DUF497 family protein